MAKRIDTTIDALTTLIQDDGTRHVVLPWHTWRDGRPDALPDLKEVAEELGVDKVDFCYYEVCLVVALEVEK